MSGTGTATLFGFTFGASHTDTYWPDFRQETWSEMVEMLTSHAPGSKEGSCIVPAKFSGTQRKKDHAERIDVVFLDSDGGATLDTITAALRSKGWEAVVSSTHSHMTTQTKVAIRNWDRFFEKNPNATAEEFLVAEKDYLPAVAAGATVGETTDDLVYLAHQPCPKFRIVMPLQRPWLAASYDNQAAANAAWKERIEALAAALGLSHDQSCVDTSRLFYLPRHPGNGVVPETAVVAGKHCDIFALPTATLEPKGGLFGSARMKQSAPLKQREFIDPVDGEIIDLSEWAKQYAGTFMIAKALKVRKPGVLTGHVADSKVHIDCPNAGSHTDPTRDGATYCINGGSSATKGFVVHCRHAHCVDKDRLSFLYDMLEGGWLGIADLTDPDFHGAADAPPVETRSRRTRRSGKGDTQWAEPIDFLADDARGAPQLLPEHLPEVIYAFAIDVAERIGVDPTGVALFALCSAASVIDDAWKIQPKRLDYSWTESARLWGGILGPPSSTKTPQLNEATRPVNKLDADARHRHRDAKRIYDDKMAAHKKALKAGEESEEPRLPKLERYLVEGATVEALQEVLRDRDDPDGRQYAPAGKVLIKQDELSEFLANMDRYKGGGSGNADRGAYLRLFNGGSYTLDRIGRGAFSVSNWSGCLVGGCQPGPIQKIAREAADDGLLQRLIWCVPGPQKPGVDRKPDYAAIKRYEALFAALSAMHPAPAVGSKHIEPIALHADGHAIRQDVEAVARAMASLPDTSPRLAAGFGKWPGMFARMILIFHMISIADDRAQERPSTSIDVVPVETIEQASTFMLDIVLPHMLRADALMFSTAQTGHAQWIAGFILQEKFTRITTRHVIRAYGSLRGPEAAPELMSVMSSLVAIGWLEPEEPENPVKPVHAWAVNPLVHTMFAARAEQAREARQKGRDLASNDLAILLKKRKAKGGPS